MITRRDLVTGAADGQVLRDLIHRAPLAVSGRHSLREASDIMVQGKVGRLPVVADDGSGRVVGILTRSDVIKAHQQRLDERGLIADATLWG